MMRIYKLQDKLMYDDLVEFEDITKDCKADAGHVVIMCSLDDVYLGYIAFDDEVEMYRFYHQIDNQQAWSEVVLYNIAEKVFTLNVERRLN